MNPWECPRCKTINAPITPFCQCKPDNGLTTLEKAISHNPAYFKVPDWNPCGICGGNHGQGRSCMTLEV